MNKKILFLIFSIFIFTLPFMAHAGALCDLVKKVRSVTLQIGGSIVAIGWVIAGILYLTAAGNSEKTGIAKKALIACIIGTILIILSTFAMGIVKDAIGSGTVDLCP